MKWLSLNNWIFTTLDYTDGKVVAEQCFRYEYDYRNRMIIKKVPGAGPVWMVYDSRDRLILTQDANMREQGKWMYTTYENDFNRPIATGLWTNGSDRVDHQSQAANSIAYPVVTGSAFEELTATFYDNYDWRVLHNNPLSGVYKADYDPYFEPVSNNWPYAIANTATSGLKGMSTGSRVKVLGTSTYLYTVIFYDAKGRVIQVQSTNISGGTDIVTTQYTWAGQPLVVVTKSEKQGNQPQTTVIVTKNSFDELGRLVKVEKKQSNDKLSNTAMSDYKTIVRNEYDKLGQLKKKEIGTNPATNSALETLNYDYNIRGWMLGVNRSYLNFSGQSGTTRFGFDLGYDKTDNAASNSYVAPQFNGNISGMTWKSDGDDVRRKYDFSYDAANRLMKGEFKQDNGGITWNSDQMNYSLQMGNGSDPLNAYDANGNIKGMTQYGWKLGGSPTTPIDNLTYSYYAGTNKLMAVSDANTTDNKLGDFFDKNTTAVDYGYDRNGNMITDLNKSISGVTGLDNISGGAIVYNHLNLPSVITIAGKGTITYTYDAAGNKLQKTVAETGQPTKTTLYMGGAVYENDVLQFFGHEEGRMRPGTTGFNYDYMIKDHLGNVRMLLTEEQKQDIYPAATLEGSTTVGALSMVNEERKYYTIDNTKIVNKPWTNTSFDYPNNNGTPANPSYPGGTTPTATATSSKVYLLNATTNTMVNKTGLGVVIKVMAGDVVNIFGRSYHKKPTSGGGYSGTTNSLAVLDILNAFVGTGVVAGKGISGSQVTGQSGFPSTMTGLIGNQPAQDANRPKAAINWIVLDEQFKWVSGGFDMVGSASNTNGVNNTYTTVDGTRKIHNLSTIPTINVPQNGYIYVWASNESKFNVFFDNLQIVHTRGAILEETHYYPFGLTMAGISSKALVFGKPENKEKTFQGQRFDDELSLNWVQFKWRNHDPQIGRFIEVDPLSESYNYNSTYAFSENKVTAHIELEGLEAVDTKNSTFHPPMANPEQTSPFTGSVVWFGGILIQNAIVRNNYNAEKAPLKGKSDPESIIKRDNIREKYRGKTPEPIKTVLDKLRPPGDEVNRPKTNAGSGSKKADNIAKGAGYFGKGLLAYGIYNSYNTISSSPTPVRETVTESTGWLGATYVGGQFAAFGTSVGGPWVGVPAGFVGGAIGFVGGKEAGDAVLNSRAIIKASIKEYNETYPIEESGNLIYHICFTKETLIYSKRGLIPIEDIRIYDSVYSYNFNDNKIQVSQVVKKIESRVDSLYLLNVGNILIKVTPEHPFYILGRGWVKTKDLKMRDVLMTDNNSIVYEINGIKKVKEEAVVYNFEVDGSHNYFITNLKILVHNKIIK